MSKCFVKELKEVVNNNNLSYVNAVAITYHKAAGATVINTGMALSGFPFTGKAEILSDNGYFTNDTGSANYGTSVDFQSETAIYVKPNISDAEVKVKFSPKAGIQAFIPTLSTIVKAKLEDFNYCVNLRYFKWEMGNSEDGVAVTSIMGLHLNSLATLNCPFLTGDVAGLASSSVSTVFADDNKLIGDFVQFVAAKADASGRVTGRFGYNVKLNGHTCYDGHNMIIVWDASSIIVKSETIQDSDKAFTYGASAAQITELENAGYTVTVCD